jgi:hypothetical protein
MHMIGKTIPSGSCALLALTFAAVGAVACHGSVEQGTSAVRAKRLSVARPAPGRSSGIPSPPIYRFDPVDVSTAVGKRPLQVWIYNSGREVGPALLSQMASAVSLRLWPELTPVPTRTRTQDIKGFDARGQGNDPYARVFVEPTAELSDRWYALYIEHPPDGLQLANDAGNAVTNTTGAYIARFRPGSEVTLVAARELTKADKHYLVLEYSEMFDIGALAAPPPMTVTAPSGDAGNCVETPAPAGTRAGARGFRCRERPLVARTRMTARSPRTDLRTSAVRFGELDRVLTGEEIIDAADGTRYVKLAN